MFQICTTKIEINSKIIIGMNSRKNKFLLYKDFFYQLFFKMRIFRSSRAVLALNGVIMIMIGLFFFIFPEKITIIMFPKVISNPEALETGVVLRYLMGAGQLAVGIILYLARISIKSGAQRLLLGSGIGFMIIFATAVFIIIKYKANIPILALSIYPLLAILSLYVATRRFQE